MLMTAFVFALLALYTLITVTALFMTRQEQRQTQNTNPLWKALSFVACVLWPVTVAVVALTIVLQRIMQNLLPAHQATPVAAHIAGE